MRRNIFKIVVVALFILLCPINVKAEVVREIPLDGYISSLPKRVGGILAEGWSAYEVTNDDHLKSGTGIWDRDEKKIYILKGFEERSIYHEIGHIFDEYCGYFSDSEEFRNIFEEEKDLALMKLFSNDDYFTNDIVEYFAETFEDYFTEPVKLLTYAPKTYAFIEKTMSVPVCIGLDSTWAPVCKEDTLDISEYLTSVVDIVPDTEEDSHVFISVSGTEVYVKSITKGKTMYKLYGPNGIYLRLRCDVTGKPTKQKKYNKIKDVISNVAGYENFCIARPNPDKFLILAQSVGDKDLKITFYDTNKKKIGSCNLSNEAKDGDDFEFMFTLNPSRLKITQEKFNTIAYYRIGVI